MQRSDQPLLPIAQGAVRQTGSWYDSDKKVARRVRFVAGGAAYAVTLTPLAFPGWTLATVIPEAEFLGPIETTIRHLLIGLALLILAAGLLSAWFARRVIAQPLITVVDELKHIERFELDQVRRHPSRLVELERVPKRHRRHGGRARRLSKIHTSGPSEDAGERRRRTASRRLDPHHDGLVRGYCRLYRAV